MGFKTRSKNNDGDLFVGNEGDLVFIDKSSGLEVPYFEILKTRSVKKWLDNLQNQPQKQILMNNNNNNNSMSNYWMN